MQIVPVTEIDIRRVAGSWPLSAEQRAEAAAHWCATVERNPHLWDGRILGLTAAGDAAWAFADGVFRAEAREDAYSTFIFWRDAGFPNIGMVHSFGTALIVSADGALIYGVMGDRTANAGQVYPPGGSLEPRDVQADGRVDVLACIATELEEETGLRATDARMGGLVAILDRSRVSFAQVFHFIEPAQALLTRIRANLERQDERELADVVAIRSRAEAVQCGAVSYAIAVAEAFEGGRIV